MCTRSLVYIMAVPKNISSHCPKHWWSSSSLHCVVRAPFIDPFHRESIFRNVLCFHLYNQQHVCCWTGDAKSQGFSSDCIDKVLAGFSTRRVKRQRIVQETDETSLFLISPLGPTIEPGMRSINIDEWSRWDRLPNSTAALWLTSDNVTMPDGWWIFSRDVSSLWTYTIWLQ